MNIKRLLASGILLSFPIISSHAVDYVSSDIPKTISPSQTPTVTSTVTVPSSAGLISDINVTLDITHTYTGDLTLTLIHPDGTEVELSSRNGSNGNDYTGTVFDQSAATSIISGSPPFTGTFRPEGNLDDFNGKAQTGTWTLRVDDGADADGGSLTGWTLSISAGAVVTGPAVHVIGGTADFSPAITVDKVTAFSAGAGLTGITGTANGVPFTYDVTFTNAAPNGARLGGDGVADLASGVTFSVNIDNLQAVNAGDSIQLDGITNFVTGNHNSGGVQLDGVDYVIGTSVNGDSNPGNGVVISDGLTSSLDFTVVGNDPLRMKAVAFQFTGTPAAAIAAPANLTVSSVASGSVSLDWDDVVDAVSYNVKRSTSMGGSYTTIATPASSTYIDNSVTNGTTYYYVVSAVSATPAESANSSEVSATPVPAIAAPTNLVVISSGDGSVALNWDDVVDAVSYKVKRSTSMGGSYTTIATPTNSVYVDTTVTNGTTYYYVVSAVNSTSEESVNSSEVSGTPAAAIVVHIIGSSGEFSPSITFAKETAFSAGAGLTGVTGSAGGVDFTYDVTFTNAAPNGARLGGDGSSDLNPGVVFSVNIVNLQPVFGGDSVQLDGITNFVTANHTSGGVSLNGVAYVIGSAVNGDNDPGNGVIISSGLTSSLDFTVLGSDPLRMKAVAFQFTATPGAFGAPQNLAVTDSGDRRVSLDWDDVRQAVAYTVKRSTSEGGPYTTIATPSTSDYIDTTVSNDTTYYYVVSAENAVPEESDDSAEVSATPSFAAPANVTITDIGDGFVELDWDDVADAISYSVRRSSTQGGPYVEIATPTESTYTDTGLTNETEYYYIVVAVNAGGESAGSSETPATPDNAFPPLVPANVRATGGDGAIRLNWDNNSLLGFSHYVVKRSSTPGGPYTQLATLTEPLAGEPVNVDNGYFDEGLSNGTEYYYVVATVNIDSEVSADSAEVSAVPALPPTPEIVLPNRPNIIFAMADDMGFGDWGKGGRVPSDSVYWATPHLDAMADAGLHMTRFYSQSAVCSPTRFSVLTGRHPDRGGITYANTGRLELHENTIYERLRRAGYRTGHFGKWHLGAMTAERNDARRGKPGVTTNYSPPWLHGVDQCFATESRTPTYMPMRSQNAPTVESPLSYDDPQFAGTRYWYPPKEGQVLLEGHFPAIDEDLPGDAIDNNMAGDDSRVLMDRALHFIEDAQFRGQPFVTCIWFHTPHDPVIEEATGAKNNAGYRDSMIGLDREMGRLRAKLEELGIWDNTIVWFCSDNGPAGNPGKTSGYRSNKGSIYEGGIRVPGIVTWPDMINAGRTTDFPIVTTDYYSTTLDILGFPTLEDELPLDGISVKDVILNNAELPLPPRSKPIAFNLRGKSAYTTQDYKLVRDGSSASWELYEIETDGFEQSNVSGDNAQLASELEASWNAWRNTVTLDRDFDRLPDAWETSKLGSTAVSNGKTDIDLDGFDDLAEYIFGSDPNDPASLPENGFHVAPGMVPVMQFKRPSGNPIGVEYKVVSRTALSSGDWIPLTNETSTSVVDQGDDTEEVTIEYPTPSENSRFYRIEAETIN